MSDRDNLRNKTHFALQARRLVDKGELAAGTTDSPESRLIAFLAAGGPALPEAKHYEEKRAGYIRLARKTATTSEVRHESVRSQLIRPRSRVLITRAAIAVAVVLAILVLSGVTSTYAMPGNPLYPVKRFTENVYAGVISGGESKANVCLSQAGERIEELEYVLERDMSEWYFDLSRDAAERIAEADREAASLDEESAGKVRARARAQAERLVPVIEEAYPDIDSAGRKVLEQEIEQLRRRLGSSDTNRRDGTTPGREGQPDSRDSPAEPENQDQYNGLEQPENQQGQPENQNQQRGTESDGGGDPDSDSGGVRSNRPETQGNSP